MATILETRLHEALVDSRRQKHAAGFPFMITDREQLPTNEAYMEYSDGSVKIVQFTADHRDYQPVRELPPHEAPAILRKHGLTE